MFYTFRELLARMEAKGNALAFVALGRMMDMLAEETGIYPDWTDIAPSWIVTNCLGIKPL